MLRIATCDDEEKEVLRLNDIIRSLFQESQKPDPRIDTFLCPSELIQKIKSGHHFYDIIFLDIIMANLNGINAAEEIRSIAPDTNFVFVTSSHDYAIQAFDLRALHYLVKPVNNTCVKEALQRYAKSILKPQISIRSSSGEIDVLLESIQYIQSKRNLLLIRTADGEIETRIPLKDFVQKLNDDFIMLSRGLVVNMSFINQMDKNSCRLQDGQVVLMSRTKRDELRSQYHNHIFEQIQHPDLC